MKKFLFLLAGIGIGFAVAHQFSKTNQGANFFSDVDARAREFGAAVVDGYQAREAELRSAVTTAQDAFDKLR